MNNAKLTRREKEKRRHKKEILEAALRLFSEKGFYNVSVQEIAEASEFGIGTLYSFFESKEALFEELINDTSELIVNELLQVLDSSCNERELLSKFIRVQPKWQKKYGKVIKLYISEVGIKGFRASKIREENKISEVINSKLALIIEQGIQKGIFRPVDPEIAAKTLGSIIETLIFETTGSCNKNEVINKFNKVEELFLEGLLLPKDKYA